MTAADATGALPPGPPRFTALAAQTEHGLQNKEGPPGLARRALPFVHLKRRSGRTSALPYPPLEAHNRITPRTSSAKEYLTVRSRFRDRSGFIA